MQVRFGLVFFTVLLGSAVDYVVWVWCVVRHRAVVYFESILSGSLQNQGNTASIFEHTAPLSQVLVSRVAGRFNTRLAVRADPVGCLH